MFFFTLNSLPLGAITPLIQCATARVMAKNGRQRTETFHYDQEISSTAVAEHKATGYKGAMGGAELSTREHEGNQSEGALLTLLALHSVVFRRSSET